MSEFKHAELIKNHKLFKCFQSLEGQDGISGAEIAELEGIVVNCANIAEQILSQISATFHQYTLHNIIHSFNIAERIYEFLPRNSYGIIPLNAIELTILWVAILLHDSGMAVSDEERMTILESKEYHNYLSSKHNQLNELETSTAGKESYKRRQIEDAIFAEFIRKQHAARTKLVIRNHFSGVLKIQGKDLSDIIATICESHCWSIPYSNLPNAPKQCISGLPYEAAVAGYMVNPQYLACCLRLGDILDFDHTRTPTIAMQYVGFTEEVSLNEWQKHLGVDGIQISEQLITLFATCDKPQQFVDINTFLDWVDEELGQCIELSREKPREVAQRYALNLFPLVRRKVTMRDEDYLAGGFRFKLEYDDIFNLLMDKALYPDSTLFLRELLQNSLDACRLQQALAAEQKNTYVPHIYVKDYSNDIDDPRIVFQDNGIGMSEEIVKDYFLRVGKSYYRSHEFLTMRDRLNAQGIQLDACSQFGIGFLSCFLGGDIIDVDTYRLGSRPLSIQIEGPSKYFLIKRQKAAEIRINPFYIGENPVDDGPPNYPGTRITVHLQKGRCKLTDVENNSVEGTEGIATRVLRQFAVNVDVPITIHQQDEKHVQTRVSYIKPRRWEEEEPPLPDGMPEFWRKFLYPYRIPFEEYEETKDIRGGAWFWFLKGEDGKPALRRGFCEVSTGFWSNGITINDPVISLAANLSNLEGTKLSISRLKKYIRLPDDEWQKKLAMYIDYLEPEEIPLLNENEKHELISILSKGARFFDGFSCDSHSYVTEDLLNALFNCDREFVVEFCCKTEITLSINYKCSFNLAQSGIAIPAGLLKYDIESGTLEREDPFVGSLPICCNIDLWGLSTVSPSANRLNIPWEKGSNFINNLGCIIIKSVCSIFGNRDNLLEYRRWLQRQDICDEYILIGMLNAFHKGEYSLLKDIIAFKYRFNGKIIFISISELVENFGRWIRCVDSEANEDGIISCNFRCFLDNVPSRVLENNCKEFDLGGILKF